MLLSVATRASHRLLARGLGCRTSSAAALVPSNLKLGEDELRLIQAPPPPPREPPSIASDRELDIGRLFAPEAWRESDVAAADLPAADAPAHVTLDRRVFALEPRVDILHDCVRRQRANWRSGLAKTKTISELSGSGKKPLRQKGSGKARQGNIRSSSRKGGQKAHGPKGPRDYSFKLNRKVVRLGLRMALSVKAKHGQLKVVDSLRAPTHKTRALANALAAHGCESPLLVCAENELDERMVRASTNLPNVHLMKQKLLGVFVILKHHHVVLSFEAVRELEERLLADFEDAALRRADGRARELETKLAEAPALAARLAARPMRA